MKSGSLHHRWMYERWWSNRRQASYSPYVGLAHSVVFRFPGNTSLSGKSNLDHTAVFRLTLSSISLLFQVEIIRGLSDSPDPSSAYCTLLSEPQLCCPDRSKYLLICVHHTMFSSVRQELFDIFWPSVIRLYVYIERYNGNMSIFVMGCWQY